MNAFYRSNATRHSRKHPFGMESCRSLSFLFFVFFLWVTKGFSARYRVSNETLLIDRRELEQSSRTWFTTPWQPSKSANQVWWGPAVEPNGVRHDLQHTANLKTSPNVVAGNSTKVKGLFFSSRLIFRRDTVQRPPFRSGCWAGPGEMAARNTQSPCGPFFFYLVFFLRPLSLLFQRLDPTF